MRGFVLLSCPHVPLMIVFPSVCSLALHSGQLSHPLQLALSPIAPSLWAVKRHLGDLLLPLEVLMELDGVCLLCSFYSINKQKCFMHVNFFWCKHTQHLNSAILVMGIESVFLDGQRCPVIRNANGKYCAFILWLLRSVPFKWFWKQVWPHNCNFSSFLKKTHSLNEFCFTDWSLTSIFMWELKLSY